MIFLMHKYWFRGRLEGFVKSFWYRILFKIEIQTSLQFWLLANNWEFQLSCISDCCSKLTCLLVGGRRPRMRGIPTLMAIRWFGSFFKIFCFSSWRWIKRLHDHHLFSLQLLTIDWRCGEFFKIERFNIFPVIFNWHLDVIFNCNFRAQRDAPIDLIVFQLGL